MGSLDSGRRTAVPADRAVGAAGADRGLPAAHAALGAAKTRLDVALEASAVGIWEFDVRTGAVAWDQRCAALFGADGEAHWESLGSALTDHVHPDDLELIEHAMAEAVHTRGSYAVEARAVRDDGTTRWFIGRGRAVLGVDGEVEGVVGTVLDITSERGQAEQRVAAIQRAATIAEVAASLVGVRDLAELSDVAFRGAEVLGANSGALAGLQPDGRLLLHLSRYLTERVAARHGLTLPVDGHQVELDDRLPAQYTARTGDAVLLPDTDAAIARFPAMAAVVELTGVQAMACLPLQVRGRSIGSFTLTWPGPREFSPADVGLMGALAAQLALTYSRLQADEALRLAADRLHLLAEAGRVLSGTLDIGEQITQLATLLVPALCDWCWVVVSDPQGRLSEMASAHRDPARAVVLTEHVRSIIGGLSDASGSRVVARTGRPMAVPVLDDQFQTRAIPDPAARAVFGSLDPASALFVPLVAQGHVLGTLALFRGSHRTAASAQEQEVATEIGLRTGLALHHAQRFDQQRQLAEALQRSMLTEPPQPDRGRIEVRYLPAASGAEIGGDWYDAFRQADGTTVLAIGDVVGHDNRAAASMGQVRGLLRGIAYSGGGTPAQVLAGLDRAMDGLDVRAMATALVARLEPVDGLPGLRLRWSSAGHPPPVRLGPCGAVALETPVARLLGVTPGTERVDSQLWLQPGQTVLLYTDGLIERRDRHLDDGLDELLAVLTELGDLPLGELCDQLLARMVLPAAEDDVALLAVRVGEPPGD